jgi:hypothetical protein
MEHDSGPGERAGLADGEEVKATAEPPATGELETTAAAEPPATGELEATAAAEPPATGELEATAAAEPPATGERRVDAALSRLAELDELPVSEHPRVYERIHEQLVEVLGDLHSAQAPASQSPAGQARQGSAAGQGSDDQGAG